MKQLLNALQLAAFNVGYVQKKGRNDFQNYNYVTEADVVAQTRKALLDADVLMVPSVQSVQFDENGNTHILVKYTVYHTASGESLEFQMAGSGNDRNSKGVGDKGIYKALTGCNKYALLKALQLATGDDPEVESDPVAKEHKSAPAAAPKPAPAPKEEVVDPTPSDEKKAFVIEPSKMDKSKFVSEVVEIVDGFVKATKNAANLRQFYTINRETWKLLESMDAAEAARIKEIFKVRSQELEAK